MYRQTYVGMHRVQLYPSGWMIKHTDRQEQEQLID